MRKMRWMLNWRQRQLVRSVVTGLAVASIILAMQGGNLFSSSRVAASDYLYATRGRSGGDIVIVAIDDKSQSALGDWPWPLAPYVQLFDRLDGADVVALDVLLSDAGPQDNPDSPALVEAVRRAGNVVLPLTSLELRRPASSGQLYSSGQIVPPFPDLGDAAADVGMVAVVLDGDSTLRRVPLLIQSAGKQEEAFALSILRLRSFLGDAPAFLEDRRVVIGDRNELKYQVSTDENGAMLVNFVGKPSTVQDPGSVTWDEDGENSFPAFSFIDVIQDRVDTSVFEDKIVLVGMMNTVGEMDVHLTPVSAVRMSGVEFQANVIHTLLNHTELKSQRPFQTVLMVIVLALLSSIALSQLAALVGAVFTVVLLVAYFFLTNAQFDNGVLPDPLFPYVTILASYAVVMAVRFASEQLERNRVSDVFGRFVSAEVRDTIVNIALDNPDLVQPGGRLAEISVLFADIRGFTTISENLSPQKVVDILNLYLDSMEAQVFKHGGTLDKYTGDGMMVIFGAPLEQPDHALRAVKAALDMQHAAAQVSQERQDVQWEVRYGIGITTGPAVVGQIGSRRRLDYTAIGDTVNLAARLEGKAPPGDILVNQATYAAVKEIVVAQELEPMQVKGKAEPVVAYRVLGIEGQIGDQPDDQAEAIEELAIES
ncbi:MAG: adenylate/guanylate cyclase domain-containing protein [Anaerolineae bacterium]|nr:adenylate/guanylate cyclase domain-containing protein [Anaerolineae bacterium]